MLEETNPSTNEEPSQPSDETTDPADPGTEPTDGSGGGGDSSGDSIDEGELARLIAQEIAKTQPTYESLHVDLGGTEAELRIVDTATRGDLLVSLLLVVAIGLFLVRWVYSGIWGR